LEQARAERARLVGEDSAEAWEALVERWHTVPRPYHEAYCRLRAACALLRAPAAAGRKSARERAGAHLGAAGTIAAELGAVYLEEEVRNLRRAAGLGARARRTPANRPVAKVRDQDRFTAREREVLRLLVAGDSNGQIGIRLGISAKTASVHVSNLLRKLEATSRVEAAMRAVRLGIVEGA
jgi:DNA-binding NarL/FixJ family response regulator